MAVVSRFFNFISKHPSEVTLVDVEQWRKHLVEQVQKPATIYDRISSKLWLQIQPCGRDLVIQILINPSRSKPGAISYNDSTPSVSFSYADYGARTQMTDGEGATSYG